MYLVIGATGNVGSEVVKQLIARGQKVRAFTRDAAKVTNWDGQVEVAVGDLTSPPTVARAASGIEGIFLMNGALDGQIFRRLITAVVEQGNPRVVFLSTLFAGFPESLIGQLHKDKEDVIRSSGLPGRFVRANAFMTNAYQWSGSIKAEGVVYNPMGNGKTAPVGPDDIAAVAVHALTAPSLTPEVFDVTGSELLTVPDQVDILARVLKKPLRCVDISSQTAIQRLVDLGTPAPVAAAVGQSYETVRDGKMALVNETVMRVTGRPARTFESWAQENASRFV